MKKILICLFVLIAGLYPKEKVKINTKKDNIIFSNSEDTKEYIKLFNDSYNKLKINFVDSINESEMIKSGIKGMLKNLDPYTKLLVGSSKESFDILRTGKYGGIGIRIGLVRDTLTVLAPMEDSPAYSEGINSGDQIFKIDSTFTFGLNTKDASNLIKGEIDSIVVLGIYRPATKEKIDFPLKRANIRVKHVPYWGIDENNVAYIKLSRFSRNSAKDFKQALISIENKSVEGLVIDLRGNSGGLLNSAITILDYLTDRGELLLSSKGKSNRSNKTWKSRSRPILDIDIPIVVLINRSSASASEIVSGTLQDLDRAVILGQKSFGKGLVQHMYDLNDTITLKITTSKYYLPSGRLIQKQDYLDNGFLTDGLDKKDSTFVTKGGRQVKGGGGVTPDIITLPNKISPYIQSLWKENVFFSFAASYTPFHQEIQIPVEINSSILNDFKFFVNDYDLSYQLEGEKEFKRLSAMLKKAPISINSYSKNISMNKNSNKSYISDMEKYFKQLKIVQFSLPENQKWIKNGLAREISRVIGNEEERIKVSLLEDSEYKRAVNIILDLKEYYLTLEQNY